MPEVIIRNYRISWDIKKKLGRVYLNIDNSPDPEIFFEVESVVELNAWDTLLAKGQMKVNQDRIMYT